MSSSPSFDLLLVICLRFQTKWWQLNIKVALVAGFKSTPYDTNWWQPCTTCVHVHEGTFLFQKDSQHLKLGMKDDFQSTLPTKKETISNEIMTQGINLKGGGGLTIGINEKWNWQIKKKYYHQKKLLRVIFLARNKETNILKLISLKDYGPNVKIAKTCFMLDFWDKTNVFVKSVDIICKWIVQKKFAMGESLMEQCHVEVKGPWVINSFF